MESKARATELASASGYAIFQRGEQLIFVSQGTSWIYTTIFVTGLLGLIAGVNGLVQIVLVTTGNAGSLVAGLILVAVGAAAGVAVRQILSHAQRRRDLQPEDLDVIATADCARGTFLGADGSELAKLADVKFVRRFQFSSSAPALAASWPKGSLVLARGNAFAGGIGDLEEVLHARGLG